MITEIGIAAGDIWHFLDEHKTATLSEMMKGIDKKKDVLMMSLGWLAREGHVILEDLGTDYRITLRFLRAVLVLTTTPDLKAAKSIAKSLVEKKLAACVSVAGGFFSTYRWKGKLEHSKEAMLFIKTPAKNFKKVENFIKSVHSYEVPEIIAIPIQKGSSEYLSWLHQSVK